MTESHARRKQDHLRITREQDINAHGVTTGLERYRLRHCALPELRLADVNLTTRFLGKRLMAPLLISAITGGTAAARQINLNLATAAQALGLAMCVGSQRAAIDNPRQARTYQVREVAPDIVLFANLGAVQLNYGYGLAECRRAVEMIAADALVLHLNPLQEALQPHGNTDFSGLLDKIAIVCRDLGAPVIIKEIGYGISEAVAQQLAAAGVAAIDVSGAGGTSWSEVEKHRAENDLQRRVAASFAHWGLSTADAILQAQRGAPNLPLIASGGVRSGPEVAVALALGAELVGLAQPLVAPAMSSALAVQNELQVLIEGLRIAMFSAGIPDVPSFRAAPLDEQTRLPGCG